MKKYADAGLTIASYDYAPDDHYSKLGAEMQRYLVDHGAKSETAELACGLGDLILTCTNDTSRNFRCGVWLREGKTIEEITSQLKTVEGLTALLNADTESYKLLHEIQDLVASHSK